MLGSDVGVCYKSNVSTTMEGWQELCCGGEVQEALRKSLLKEMYTENLRKEV